MPVTRALTITFRNKTSEIVTPVDIHTIDGKRQVKTLGLWDTGATGSVITREIAEILNLKPIDRIKVKGVNSVVECNVYLLKLVLNNGDVTFDMEVTECEKITDNGVGMLIGMNVINLGDFAITNFNNETTFSFQIPPVETIDFVKKINYKKNK